MPVSDGLAATGGLFLALAVASSIVWGLAADERNYHTSKVARFICLISTAVSFGFFFCAIWTKVGEGQPL